MEVVVSVIGRFHDKGSVEGLVCVVGSVIGLDVIILYVISRLIPCRRRSYLVSAIAAGTSLSIA